QQELYGEPGGAVLDADQARLGGEVKSSVRDGRAGALGAGGGEAHGGAEGEAEVLAVVVAGGGEDGPAGGGGGVEGALQVADGVAQGLRAGQLAEQVAGDEQDVHGLGLAVVGDALDGPAQVVGAVDAAEAVGEVPVSGVQDPHARSVACWARYFLRS